MNGRQAPRGTGYHLCYLRIPSLALERSVGQDVTKLPWCQFSCHPQKDTCKALSSRACTWAFEVNFHLPLEASYSWIWAIGSSLPVGASLIEQGSGRRVSGQGTEIRLPAAQTFAEVALKLHLLPHGQIPGRPLGAPEFTVTVGLLPPRARLPGPC